MGSLKLPANGTVYVDTQAIVYSVERHAKYSPLMQPLWAAQQAGNVAVAASQLSYMECLVMPLRNGDAPLVAAFELTFQSTGMIVTPIDGAILRLAAQLRAAHKSLRTPDAIHAATAIGLRTALFVTNDRGFCAVRGLPIALLDDILAAP